MLDVSLWGLKHVVPVKRSEQDAAAWSQAKAVLSVLPAEDCPFVKVMARASGYPHMPNGQSAVLWRQEKELWR